MAKTASFQDEAYQALKNKILRLELKPGIRIVQKEMQNELGIGATPVREALLRLHRDGLLEVFPQSGTFVSKIDLSEVYQARFVRESIEKLIVTEAITKITASQLLELRKLITLQEVYLHSNDYANFFDLDEAFHRTFYIINRKEFVWKWLQVVNMQFNRFRYLRLEEANLDWQQIFDDHRAIVDAIINKQPQKAALTVSRHLHMVDNDIKIALKMHPDYFKQPNI